MIPEAFHIHISLYYIKKCNLPEKDKWIPAVVALDPAAGREGAGVQWPVVISMWWIRTNAGPRWDTEGHSRWRKLKSCNYVFLWGGCSDSHIFITSLCSRCDDHMLPLILLSSPLLCGHLFFYWAVWCIDHHFLPNMHRLLWLWAVRTLCPSLETYWALPASRCLKNCTAGVLPVWKTVLSLPQFPCCYEIIDEEKPTHAGCSQKHLMLQAAAHAWPFNHT